MPREKAERNRTGGGKPKSQGSPGTSKPGGGSVASGGQSTRSSTRGGKPGEPRPSKLPASERPMSGRPERPSPGGSEEE